MLNYLCPACLESAEILVERTHNRKGNRCQASTGLSVWRWRSQMLHAAYRYSYREIKKPMWHDRTILPMFSSNKWLDFFLKTVTPVKESGPIILVAGGWHIYKSQSYYGTKGIRVLFCFCCCHCLLFVCFNKQIMLCKFSNSLSHHNEGVGKAALSLHDCISQNLVSYLLDRLPCSLSLLGNTGSQNSALLIFWCHHIVYMAWLLLWIRDSGFTLCAMLHITEELV